MMNPEVMNQSADYWYKDIGVNVIPANTKDKNTFEKWSNWENQSIPDQLHEERKRNGSYDKGIALIPGPLRRERYAGKYLVAIDLDNKKAIEEFCKDGLDELKQQTLVEQTSNPDKMHIYFIVEREIPNKSSDKVDVSKVEKIQANEIPALEVKSNGKGIMFCSDSPHQKDGHYQIKGTLKPKVFDAQVVEDRIGGICDKFGIPYGSNNNNTNSSSNNNQIPIEDLWKTETKILEGHNRHLELLRIMESLLQNNRKMPLDMIKQMAQMWNQEHCIPPLDDREFERQWKDAIRFVGKSINDDNNHYNGNGHKADNNKEQEKTIIVEKVSISEAIRRNSGRVQVTGTITGITIISQMVSKVQLYCDKCADYSECSFNPIPVTHIKNIKEKCNICERTIKSYNIKPLDFKSSVLIELQDTDTFDDLDRLPVFLFEKDTVDINKRIGENVEVIGKIKIVENNFKYFSYLYCESVKYLNQENFVLTDSDIEKIKQFNEIHKNEEGGTIRALIERFDPSIIDCVFEKEGILYVTVNTSPKIGYKSQHIDILIIGPPGLAKTTLLERGVELVPGSNKIGGQYATGKSITAIVEKTDSNTFLRLGSIPRSKNAICGINELSKLHNEDLAKLYDVMSGRRFPFEKFGIKADIKTPTAIIATANPGSSDSWISNEKVDWNEIPGLAPLEDRFGLIFILRKRSQKENDEFTDKWAAVQAKKEKGELPDYTEFIVKYIQYAKKIEPVLTDEARYMLKEFYKTVNATGFGSPRVLNTLNNLSRAVARLKLKNVVDEEDAKKAQEFYSIMLANFQKSVVYSESPKILAYKKGVEILERNKNFNAISLEELIELICKEDKQLAMYFGYDKEKSLKIKDNSKTQDVRDLLLNNSHIKKISENPIVLKWFDTTTTTTTTTNTDQSILSDVSDVSDKEIDPEKEKNHEKKNESGLGSASHTSFTSLSEEEAIDKFLRTDHLNKVKDQQ